MNKNRGIWLVIAAILVIGIAVTFLTSRFIRLNGGTLDTTAVQQVPYTTAGTAMGQPRAEANAKESPAAAGRRSVPAPAQAPARAETEAKPDGAEGAELKPAPKAAAFSMEAASSADEALVPDAAPEQEALEAAPKEEVAAAEAGPGASGALAPSISPLEPASALIPGSGTEEKAAYYEKRLSDLDIQVQKMRSESSDSTTYSMKTLAEKELNIWNIEMNSIYAVLMETLDDESKTSLENSQQEWAKSRDTKAEEAARKYSGGSLEGVEYTASLAESTRERAYSLVEEYGNVLPAEKE